MREDVGSDPPPATIFSVWPTFVWFGASLDVSAPMITSCNEWSSGSPVNKQHVNYIHLILVKTPCDNLLVALSV